MAHCTKQLVGSLTYLTATKPDLMYVVCLISRFMAQPREAHLSAAKRVLRYLKSTTELGVFYRRGVGDELVAYIDSDYAGDIDGRRSTSGFVFMLSCGAVSWSSRKQSMLKFCGSNEQIADILTKPLKLETFEKLHGLLGVKAKGEEN
ncbi:secreted RxLR effector protein 161-like [Rosa rugosa]|uniref:secreted RxLR effector protein 161-like n=1 Tax=Rosa rugosa TaxID=74645 RepID=UPI002B4070E6|nr:secreted RxLR effector protein 161-like [Rosa rugosa]